MHVQTRLIAIVISKFGKWKRFLPILYERDNTSSEHVFQDLINPFNLTARLRMESCTEGEMSSHSILKASPESRGEKATTIRIDYQRNTVKRHNSRDVQVCQLTSSYRLANGKEVRNFGKPIYDNEDGIISFLGFWKAGDEVHTDFVSFPLGNRQRLKCVRRSRS